MSEETYADDDSVLGAWKRGAQSDGRTALTYGAVSDDNMHLPSNTQRVKRRVLCGAISADARDDHRHGSSRPPQTPRQSTLCGSVPLLGPESAQYHSCFPFFPKRRPPHAQANGRGLPHRGFCPLAAETRQGRTTDKRSGRGLIPANK